MRFYIDSNAILSYLLMPKQKIIEDLIKRQQDYASDAYSSSSTRLSGESKQSQDDEGLHKGGPNKATG